MAIREAVDRMMLKFHSSKEFSHPIPSLVQEAEGCTERIVWLWEDFGNSLNRHLRLSKNVFGRPRNKLQQIAFWNGIERLCAEFTRRCENLTMKADFQDSSEIALRIHRLRSVPLKDRHRNQPFVASIPEVDATVPVRATFVGMQDELEATSELPIAAAVEAIPLQRSEDSPSYLAYAEVMG